MALGLGAHPLRPRFFRTPLPLNPQYVASHPTVGGGRSELARVQTVFLTLTGTIRRIALFCIFSVGKCRGICIYCCPAVREIKKGLPCQSH